MSSEISLPEKRQPAKRRLLRKYYVGVILYLLFMNVAAAQAQAQAGSISVFRDDQGRYVYVNSDDRELSALVKSRGVTAARNAIDARKRALSGVDEFIEQAALQQRLDPRLVRAIIEVESAWNIRARSRKGALGLMQLMPETAARFGVRDPFDAKDNIGGGTRYLRFLLDHFHENLKYSLAAYNAGENAVEAWGDVPPYEETKSYLKRVDMIYAAKQQREEPKSSGISRAIQGNRVVYTNLD